MNKIMVKEFVGSPYCSFPSVRANDLRQEIEKHIQEEKKIQLDFTGIELLTSAFLNYAIGALYFDIPPECVKKYLSVTNACQDDLRMIKLVVDNAKRFYNHLETNTQHSETQHDKGDLNEPEKPEIRLF